MGGGGVLDHATLIFKIVKLGFISCSFDNEEGTYRPVFQFKFQCQYIRPYHFSTKLMSTFAWHWHSDAYSLRGLGLYSLFNYSCHYFSGQQNLEETVFFAQRPRLGFTQ